jgi:G6PDH family F420-dependent oxidoreductase
MEIGYTLSSEEHHPLTLVTNAAEAEARGFDFVTVSDHFHPWVKAQGHSPFVWSTLGGIALTTREIGVGVGVSCPIIRIHPAVVAQAAATAASMMDGRFFLGLGTGELLNEHVVGQRWPRIETRQRMLTEAIMIMRQLWTGDVTDVDGEFFNVENARIYTLPATPPPIFVSAFGESAAVLAAQCECGLWAHPEEAIVKTYRDAGGLGEIVGQLTVCWAEDREAAVQTAFECWPTAGLSGQLSQELPSPELFEDACVNVTKEAVAEKVPCGPDPGPVLDRLEEFRSLGFTRVHLHQIGPDQDGFFDFWSEELRPQFASA